ncbi:MAG: class I SAM-dependent methyltransferase [Chitinophagaceae bacterium]|nr:class I SAM-dependent methyltransferase [Chitinophagaceae bacterium]
MTTIDSSEAYYQFAYEYDAWFEKHSNLYQSELLAMKKVVPKNKKGIEIGVGSGRFAEPLNIKYGVEPSASMAALAKQRGVKVIDAVAEKLPIEDQSYDFATMVTTVCFLNNIPKAFAEVHRILKPKGTLIIGLIDRKSDLGKKYEQQKSTNKFYRDAHFHSTEEITELLSQAGFQNFSYWQTLLNADENVIEQPQPGYGKGSFVVIKGIK